MASPRITDCYRVLGIDRDATLKDINSAYKKLALKHHPDKVGRDGSSHAEFQKIQQAVEILRDPTSRRDHDEQLGPRFFDDDIHFQFAADYTGWRPHVYAGRSTHDRYAFTYGNSVHMDPHSNESSEERAHWERMRMFGHGDLVPEEPEGCPAAGEAAAAEKPEWEARVGVMEERLRREGDGSEPQFWYDETMVMNPVDEEDVRQRQSYFSEQEEEYDEPEYAEDEEAEAEGEEEVGEQPEYEEGAFSYGDDDDDAGDLSSAEYETANQAGESFVGADTDSACEEEPANMAAEVNLLDTDYDTASTTSFYEARTVQSTTATATVTATATATNLDPVANPSTSIPSPIPNPNPNSNSNPKLELHLEPEPTNPVLAPFVPYFQSKLDDPSQRYTSDDLSAELKGIVLETYCGWLETLRQSFPDARPRGATDPEECPHLGAWVQRYGCAECEACRRWRPLCALACPGCGITRCVGCKFGE
ncbi:DnaJ domain-containing protein [Aspergillus sp. HF37]|nr:DnaJ domain-containing protein [Aspergillus sp. HF37]